MKILHHRFMGFLFHVSNVSMLISLTLLCINLFHDQKQFLHPAIQHIAFGFIIASVILFLIYLVSQWSLLKRLKILKLKKHLIIMSILYFVMLSFSTITYAWFYFNNESSPIKTDVDSDHPFNIAIIVVAIAINLIISLILIIYNVLFMIIIMQETAKIDYNKIMVAKHDIDKNVKVLDENTIKQIVPKRTKVHKAETNVTKVKTNVKKVEPSKKPKAKSIQKPKIKGK